MGEYKEIETVIDYLKNTPLIPQYAKGAVVIGVEARLTDVRHVVLCRDCKYAPIGDNDGSDLEWPFNEFDENPCPYKCLDNWYSHKPAPDFFCAAGEKREKS